MPQPTVGLDENFVVVSSDGSTRIKRKIEPYSAIMWKLPGWTVVTAASEYAMDLIVNAAEYRGLFIGFDICWINKLGDGLSYVAIPTW